MRKHQRAPEMPKLVSNIAGKCEDRELLRLATVESTTKSNKLAKVKQSLVYDAGNVTGIRGSPPPSPKQKVQPCVSAPPRCHPISLPWPTSQLGSSRSHFPAPCGLIQVIKSIPNIRPWSPQCPGRDSSGGPRRVSRFPPALVARSLEHFELSTG